ncbi:uncharacterized protein LOC124167380 [Ischnura elegans]|uniref:uncharacterized protein LOC124167380 n=1 Tax=Ischnura elegans TaxID=197161 RepID=UPI001ED870F1|nr:uncharacterized protein LOC124167380 [Ischnura elegans]
MSFLSYDNLSDEQIVNILISDGDTSDLENLSDDEDAVNEVAVIDQEGGDHEDNPSDDNDVDVYEIINLPEDIPGPSTSKASSSSTREKRSTSQRQNRERSASSSQGTSESHQSSQAPRQPPNPDPAVRKEIFNSLNLTDRKSISWTKGPLDSHAINFYELPPKEVTSLPSPYEYFQRYITDDLVQDMVEKTNLYATRTNVANFPPYLLKKDIYAIGTIRINRFSNPPLTDDPKVKKNQKRGYAEEVRSNDG